jgi:AcrR family transcriptional regulator
MTMRDGGSARERILTEVTRLFIKNGYHGTGVQEISDAVGLRRGGLYHHIGSKERLLFEISMGLLQEAISLAQPVAAGVDAPDVKLRALARDLLHHHAVHGDGWSVAIHEARFLSEVHRKEVNSARDTYEGIWRGVMDEGAAAGSWRAVDELEVRGILGMFNSAARWIRLDGPLGPEEIADRYIELLLYGLRQRHELRAGLGANPHVVGVPGDQEHRTRGPALRSLPRPRRDRAGPWWSGQLSRG